MADFKRGDRIKRTAEWLVDFPEEVDRRGTYLSESEYPTHFRVLWDDWAGQVGYTHRENVEKA